MGACITHNSQHNNALDRVRPHRQGNLTFQIHSNNYKALIVSGKGCKQTPAWETELTKAEIEGKIKEFWETRIDGNPRMWEKLKEACMEPDVKKAEAIVRGCGLRMHDGMISLCYDERGHRFELPPFVLNPAIKYGEGEYSKDVIHEEFPVKDIELVLRAAGETDKNMIIKTNESIKSIKEQYLKDLGRQKNIKLFFNGKEMKDNKRLGEFKVDNQFVLQVFIKN